MNRIIFKQNKPDCHICGKKVESWNPMGTIHEHVSCRSELIANKLLKNIKL